MYSTAPNTCESSEAYNSSFNCPISITILLLRKSTASEAVCSFLETELRLNNPTIQNTLIDLARSGGKLLRPAFCLLFAELGSKKEH
ncbi:hypothetical protein IGJ05_001533 [Enterococcus sp. AZ167]